METIKKYLEVAKANKKTVIAGVIVLIIIIELIR